MNEKIKSSILGFFIGLAIIVPGFSGAQMAIIFKLYDKLIAAMDKLFTKKSILFLIPIAIGAVIGFAIGLVTVKELLKLSVFAVTATFAGMMFGSIRTVTDEVKTDPFKKKYIFNILIGFAIPLTFSALSIYSELNFSDLLVNTPIYFYFIALLLGFLIALTQLIPGLSATALLLTFGLYNALLGSVSITFWQANPHVILIYLMFALGGIIGIITLSKLINRCLINYKTSFYYVIIGLCLSNICCMFFNPEIFEFYMNMGTNGYIHIIVGVIMFIISSSLMYLLYHKTTHKEKLI